MKTVQSELSVVGVESVLMVVEDSELPLASVVGDVPLEHRNCPFSCS